MAADDLLAERAQSSLKLSGANSPPTANPSAEASQPPHKDADAVTRPALPPGLAAARGKTVEEVLADLNRSPLFMTEMEENDDVAALQALAYEGTPLENASDFKERGNECFRERRWADAREFYGKGVALLTAEQRRRARGEPPPPREGDDPDPDAPQEVARQEAVLAQLYVNRAACQLELSNFRSATLDCASALRLDDRNLKAWYRSARALLALGRVKEADEACARGLDVDGGNAALLALQRETARKRGEMTEKQRRDETRAEKVWREKLVLRAALAARGIKTRATEQPPEMEDAGVRLVPDPADPKSSLSFPVVLLYPLQLETDFIKAFNETESLEQHLGYVFPVPWDREGVYTTGGVECYMETLSGGLVKVGKKLPLLKILSTGNVEVVDEVVRIFVVPRSKSEGWVKEFKAKKAAEKS